MKQGQRFEFGGHDYEIDLIGPRMTLLTRDDGAWQLIDTETLRNFLGGGK
jgi:hypothetical protein